MRSLLVTYPTGLNRRVSLSAGPVTIGRGPGCAVRLVSPPWLPLHAARVERTPDGARVVDDGGVDGVRVNGAVVREAPLRVGDVIVIGEATLECLAESTVDERLWLDAPQRDVWIGARRLERRLSAQEFRALAFLYGHTRGVCARDEIGAAVWGADAWDANMLHQVMHRVKAKLEPEPTRPRYLHSVPRVGYRLTP
jgi:hypothetical protein